MSEHKQLPIICFFISYFLLLCPFRLSAVVARQEDCSCGQIHDIRWPYGLNTSRCGNHNPVFYLLCVGNKTFLEINSSKYHVTEISYENHTIKLQYDGLPHASCALPTQTLSYKMLAGYNDNRFPFFSLYTSWVSFVNCTSEITDQMYYVPLDQLYYQMYYVPLPCFRGKSMFVYAVYSLPYTSVAYQLRFLQPSCHFLAMHPTADDITPRSQEEVFQLLQNGITLGWFVESDDVIHECLQDYSRRFRMAYSGILSLPRSLVGSGREFVGCLNGDKSFSQSILNAYRISIFLWGLTPIVLVLIALSILVRFIFAPISVCIFLAHKFYTMRASVDTVEKFLLCQKTVACTRFSYTDLIAMTCHFREKLGQGGFGSVFKGNILGRLVAVKMLGNSKCDGDEFISEVSTIGRIHHVNVVHLVGFCSEGSKRALVYEYMSNGSLDKYIFSSKNSVMPFTEEKLYEIALSVARGIDYLHRGCDMRILHFDIKPHNILLDHKFNPKLSDFGLAKLYPKDYSIVSFGAARGTIGYIAPELISRSFGVISYKSDVYSFGMLLMEMAGGRRNVNSQAENSSQVYYPSWIYDQLTKVEVPELDDNINVEIGEVERKLCKVGLWCIQMKPSDRPSMAKVVEMLQSNENDLQMPPKPFFSSGETTTVTLSYLDSCPTELSTISEDE